MGEVSGSAHRSRRDKGKAPQLVIDPDDVTLTPSKIIVKHIASGGYFCMGFGPSAEFLRAVDEDRRFGAAIDEAEIALRKRGSAFARNEDPFLRRLGAAVALAKDGFDPNQPRDDHGRWTGDGSGAGAATASAASDLFGSPKLISGLRQIATRLLSAAAAIGTNVGATAVEVGETAAGAGTTAVSAGIAFLGVLFFPINSRLRSEGTVPDAPDLGYRFDQDTGVLTLSRTNADGTKDILFSGQRGADSLFRDKDGNVIGSDLGGSIVIDPNAVPGYQSRAKEKERSDAGAIARPVAIADTDQPKLCPDPGPDKPGWDKRSDQSLAYQEQISGLPRGLAVDLNGVSFDGCRQDGDTFTMLDAKGQGYLWAMQSGGTWYPFYTGIDKLMVQAKNQVDAAGDRQIEWYFAEKPVADYMRDLLAKAYGDGGGADIYVADTDRLSGMMFNHCGGDAFFDALYELARRTGSVIYWPGFGRHSAIADSAVIQHLPPDLIKSCGEPVLVHDRQGVMDAIRNS